MVRFRWLRVWLLLGLAISAASCGGNVDVGEFVDESVNRVRQTVEQGVEEVKQSANLAGDIQLTLNPPVQTKACYTKFFFVDADRPAVLQICSYPSAEAEKFPSVCMRALVQASSAAELAGKTVSAEVFVQPSSQGPVWHSRGPGHVQLQIEEVSDDSIAGKILGGQLVSTESGQPIDVTGTFSGSLR
jgi:hypothetical protein